MNRFVIVAALLVLAVAVVNADIWSNCGSTSDHLKIQNVVITPDPPQKGQNLTVSATGYLDETVTDGKVTIQVKYGFITILNKAEDICTAVTPNPCPIAAGTYSRSVTAEIPSSVPSGHYTGKVVVTDQSGSEIACIALDFHLAYAVLLKDRMNISQAGLLLIGSLSNVGTYLSAIPLGMVLDRAGFRILLLLAIVLYTVGYLLVWSVIKFQYYTDAWLLGLLFAIIGVGNTCLIDSSVVVNTRNLSPRHRGKVIGAETGAMALGGIVFAWMSDGFSTAALFPWFFFTVGAIAVVSCVAALLLMRSLPWTAAEEPDDESAPMLHRSSVQTEPASPPSTPPPQSIWQIYVDATGVVLARKPHFLLFLLALLCATGSGLLMINNAGSLLHALQSPLPPPLVVSVLSAASFVGRVGTGSASDALAARVPRLLLLVLLLALAAASFLLAAYYPRQTLWPAAVLVGVSYGGSLSLANTVVSEWFGTRWFGANAGWLLLSPGLGSLSFNYVAGFLYDRNVPPGQLSCVGDTCYRAVFLFAAGGAALACVLFAVTTAATWTQWRQHTRGARLRATPAPTEPPPPPPPPLTAA